MTWTFAAFNRLSRSLYNAGSFVSSSTSAEIRANLILHPRASTPCTRRALIATPRPSCFALSLCSIMSISVVSCNPLSSDWMKGRRRSGLCNSSGTKQPFLVDASQSTLVTNTWDSAAQNRSESYGNTMSYLSNMIAGRNSRLRNDSRGTLI